MGWTDRIREEQSTGRQQAPVLDTTLQSPKLARLEHPGVLPAQTLEEFLRRPMRFGFQPLHNAGPSRLERIPPGSPVSWRALARLVRRPHLAGAPGRIRMYTVSTTIKSNSLFKVSNYTTLATTTA